MKKLDVVNFLRGYSIFTIVIMHLVGMLGISGIWEKAAAFGGAGVHVLSSVRDLAYTFLTFVSL